MRSESSGPIGARVPVAENGYCGGLTSLYP
jgi:hypothetical protein